MQNRNRTEAWMIFLYAVDTHHPLPSPPLRYETEEMCKIDALAVAENGISYAICRQSYDGRTQKHRTEGPSGAG